MPVSDEALEGGGHYLANIVSKYVQLVMEESMKVEGIMSTLKTNRVTKVREEEKEEYLNIVSTSSHPLHLSLSPSLPLVKRKV